MVEGPRRCKNVVKIQLPNICGRHQIVEAAVEVAALVSRANFDTT